MSDEAKLLPGKVASQWWDEFCEPEKGDRAVRAKLRRCKGWQDAMLVPAALLLAARLGMKRDHPWDIENALDLAVVLAHVKERSKTPLFQSCGFTKPPRSKESSPEQPRLAVVRFTRLMRSTRDELPLALIRLVRLLDGTANIEGLTQAILDWDKPHWGDHVRRDWAFDYYGARLSNNETTKSDTEGTNP
ncbi:MAG: hypothetical protein RL186_318 [Pseudomonadota bacterium]